MATPVTPASPKWGLLLIITVLVAAAGAGGWYWHEHQHPAPPPGPVPAPSVTISGPTTAKVGHHVKLTIAADPGAAIDWTAPTGDAYDFEPEADSRTVHFVARQPGDASFSALALGVVNGKPAIAKGAYKLTVEPDGVVPVPPAPTPTDPLSVAAIAELKSHVSAWAAIKAQLAAGTLKAADIPAALASLKTPAAAALSALIGQATDQGAAFGTVGAAQAGMLK